jgi:thiol-disulfide isomerase/thioredoxin
MHLLRAVLALALCACAKQGAGPPVGMSGAAQELAPRFSFDSLDERPVSSDAMRGKVGVIVFVTTYDWASQAEVDFIVPIAKKNDPRVAFAMVALQSPSDRELVEHYRDTLGVTFPTALADVAGASSVGFGEVRSVPTVIVLDASGKLVFHKEGIVKGDELRHVIEIASERSKP